MNTHKHLGTTIAVALVMGFAMCSPVIAQDIIRETFDTLPKNQSIESLERWQAFPGFGNKAKPTTEVRAEVGVNGSAALAVWHTEPFRTDNYGIRIALANPLESGVVWIRCQFKAGRDIAGGLFFDARNQNDVVARIAGNRFENKAKKQTNFRWHASWEFSYWRLYTESDLDSEQWRTLTMRLDLDTGYYAAWVNSQLLGEHLPMCAKTPVTHLYLSGAGTKQNPVLFDNLQVSREAPKDVTFSPMLPEPKKGLLFRFAAIGDPQLGFAGYDADKVRFRMAVDQVNESKADLSLILGDMVHLNDNEQAYRDVVAIAKHFQNPHYYVRGNHERIDFYKKHFHPKLEYSVEHKGFRFVFLDAIGNHAGLNEAQLKWVAEQFSQAETANQEIVLVLHVSPWEANERGRAKYNQIGEGRNELRKLMKQHKVLLCLNGHYHRGYWHAKEEETHYLALGGTARVAFGYLSWSIFDVYPDRVEIYQKPLFFGYEQENAKQYHNGSQWRDYASTQESFPYQQIGPLIISRQRPKR